MEGGATLAPPPVPPASQRNSWYVYDQSIEPSENPFLREFPEFIPPRELLSSNPGGRTVYKLPPGDVGGKFILPVPKRGAQYVSFAPMEQTLKPGPRGGLAGKPNTLKTWANTTLYHPEQVPGQCAYNRYNDRYVQTEDGTWLDTWRARRKGKFISDKLEQELLDMENERKLAMGRAVNFEPDVRDPYTGESLVEIGGELMTAQNAEKRYKLRRSDWADLQEDLFQGADYDMLRLPVPAFMEYGGRNKRINMDAYEWLDRRNPHIPTDSSYDLMETETAVVDRELHQHWRSRDSNSPWDYMLDLYDHYTSID
mmetsp:Transcript_11938/g.26369  ORF Transcript_11938/g.26369 Transcript_11938/m.26369 type:complete len:312 (+) Transcript_11938:87-1022(+)